MYTERHHEDWGRCRVRIYAPAGDSRQDGFLAEFECSKLSLELSHEVIELEEGFMKSKPSAMIATEEKPRVKLEAEGIGVQKWSIPNELVLHDEFENWPVPAESGRKGVRKIRFLGGKKSWLQRIRG